MENITVECASVSDVARDVFGRQTHESMQRWARDNPDYIVYNGGRPLVLVSKLADEINARQVAPVYKNHLLSKLNRVPRINVLVSTINASIEDVVDSEESAAMIEGVRRACMPFYEAASYNPLLNEELMKRRMRTFAGQREKGEAIIRIVNVLADDRDGYFVEQISPRMPKNSAHHIPENLARFLRDAVNGGRLDMIVRMRDGRYALNETYLRA